MHIEKIECANYDDVVAKLQELVEVLNQLIVRVEALEAKHTGKE